jgi:hypothetical protein
MKYIKYIVVVITVSLAAWVAFAKEAAPLTEEPVPASTELVPSPAPPALAPPADPTELFDPAVAAVLQAQWASLDGNAASQFTEVTNATILSQPSGFDVFMISVSDVRAAEQGSSNVTVESLVFNDAHYLGQTPLTVSLVAQDYVLAVRSTKRAGGFDGDCVRQFTRDPITGGRRYDYHLYPFKKDRSNYACFVANFLAEGFSEKDVLAVVGSDSLFAIPETSLLAALASGCQAKAELQPRIAKDLLEYGVAFYKLDGQPYLVKLNLNGLAPVIKEWPVTEEVKS